MKNLLVNDKKFLDEMSHKNAPFQELVQIGKFHLSIENNKK